MKPDAPVTAHGGGEMTTSQPHQGISDELRNLVKLSRKRIVPAPRVGVWIFTALVSILIVYLVVQFIGNPRIGYQIIGDYFFSRAVLQGVWTTLWITAVVTALAMAIGAILAAMRLSGQRVLMAMSWSYIWLFRSVPLLVQLLFWFNIGYLIPVFNFGIPGLAPWFSFDTVNVVSAITAAIIGLTVHESAPAAEIIRGGLVGVDEGQREAAFSLALKPSTAFFRITLPQAMRIILPGAFSLLIGTLKSTALLSVIAITDLLYTVQLVYNRTFQVIPLLVVASLWYLVITSVLSVIQHRLEARFARGSSRSGRAIKAARMVAEEQA